MKVRKVGGVTILAKSRVAVRVETATVDRTGCARLVDLHCTTSWELTSTVGAGGADELEREDGLLWDPYQVRREPSVRV